jgi:hypothetical protein
MLTVKKWNVIEAVRKKFPPKKLLLFTVVDMFLLRKIKRQFVVQNFFKI